MFIIYLAKKVSINTTCNGKVLYINAMNFLLKPCIFFTVLSPCFMVISIDMRGIRFDRVARVNIQVDMEIKVGKMGLILIQVIARFFITRPRSFIRFGIKPEVLYSI